MFKKGDKVICVDDKVFHPEWIITGTIRNGSIYTVRDVETSEYSNSGIRLEEVSQKIHPLVNLEYTFHDFRFRKLWDNKQLSKIDEKIYEKV